ncbi:MAG: hypothetical protein KGM43_19235, partial [Planctomycetota bacterium]|nr:hypothetical protein [Planctomycetota bacterium]
MNADTLSIVLGTIMFTGSNDNNQISVSYSASPTPTYTFHEGNGDVINANNDGTLNLSGAGSATVTVSQGPGPILNFIVDGGGGTDSINIGSSGTPGAVTNASGGTENVTLAAANLADTTVSGGATGAVNLTVNDLNDPATRTVTVSPSSIVGLAPGHISYSNLATLDLIEGIGPVNLTTTGTSVPTTLNTGTGGTTTNLEGTSAAGPVTINPQGGVDAVNIGFLGLTSGILGAINVVPVGGIENITVDDSADMNPATAVLSDTVGGATSQITGIAPATISYQVAGQGATSLTVKSGGGASGMTVDFANGNPIPFGPVFTSPTSGLIYDGNGTSDGLRLQNGSFTNETYNATGPGAGNIRFDASQPITFAGLKPITDTVTATNFTFNAPPNAFAYDIVNGPLVGTTQTAQILSGDSPSAFELINFGNKVNAAINAYDGPNLSDVTLQNSLQATGLATMTVNTGGGNDDVQVEAIEPNVATTINTGAGNDVFHVHGGALTAAAASSASLAINGGPGTNTLIFDAVDQSVSYTTPGVIQITSAAAIPLNYSNIAAVTITNVAPQTLTLTPSTTLFAVAGTPFVNQLVATVSTTDTNTTAADLTASIDWGDGSPATAATIVAGGGIFDIAGSHTYKTSGPETITLSATNTGTTGTTVVGGVPITVQSNPSLAPVNTPTIALTVADAPLTSAGAAIGAERNVAFTGDQVATFTSTNPFSTLSQFTAMINWGDASAATPGVISVIGTGPNGVTYAVAGSHSYGSDGKFAITTTITSTGGSGSTALGQATVVDPPLNTTPIDFTVNERAPFYGPVASFSPQFAPIAIPDSPGNYAALISWGDGTPETPGQIVSVPGGLQVIGQHIYADSLVNGGSNTFPVAVTIYNQSGKFFVVNDVGTVNDVPIALTGHLDPASDSGVSNHDGITNVNQPIFDGTSEPFSTVNVFATPAVPGGMAFLIGQTTASPDGSWIVRSSLLPDDRYNISAYAIDQAGHTTATTQILPSATEGALTIDTVAPTITNVAFDRIHSTITITYQDGLSGMNPASLVDGANYQVSHPHFPLGNIL